MSAIRWPVGQYIVEVEKLEPGIWHWDLLDIAGDSLIPFDDADLQIVDSHEAAMSRALGKAATLYMKLEDVEIPRMTSPAPKHTEPANPAESQTRERMLNLLKLRNCLWAQDQLEAAKQGLVAFSLQDLTGENYSPYRLWSWSKHSLKVCIRQDSNQFCEIHHIQPNSDTAFPYTAYLLPDGKELFCKPWLRLYVGGAGAFYVVLKPILEQILQCVSLPDANDFDYASIREIEKGIEMLGKDALNIPRLVMGDWHMRLTTAISSLLIGHPPTLMRRVEEAYFVCTVLYAAEL